jgi:hypothetical protein
MGYSNVAGALNVFTSTSTQDLVVRGDTIHLGNILSTQGFATFGNASIGNLVVTGNFTITATNTQTTNALSINNAGTATALKVTQSEGGGPGHVHNVAEFWDFQTLAMVIDPEGNVAIHTGASPGASLTVVGGAIVDTLALGSPLPVSSGGTGTASTTNNWVFAGPTVSAPGPPSFRSLVSGDLPDSIVVSNVTANGASLSALQASNIVGNVAQANVALVVSQPFQPNVTQVGTLVGLYSSGNVTASFFAGQGNALSNIQSAALVGNVASANVALVVSQPLQPNITQVGTLVGLFSSGNVTASFFAGQGNGLTNVISSVLVGNVANANVALVVSQPLQPNITQVGTLVGLYSSGNVTASFFAGQGNALSNIQSSVLVGNVANANVALVVSQPLQPNITQVGTLTGLYSTGNVTASFFAGQGNGLTNIQSSVLVGNVASANVALVVSQPLQPNITQVGTLTGLFSSGNVTASFFAGQGNALSNIQSSVLVGNVASANVALVVSQPAQPNITSVGTLTSLDVSGNIYAANAVTTTNIFTAGFTSNATNTVFNFDTLTVPFVACTTLNVSTVANVLTLAGSLVTAAQPNVTSLGTLTGLTVQGLLTASNGSGIANLTAAAITGNVAQANVALMVSQPLQPNITQVGTLVGLYATGNITASYFAGQGNGLTNVQSSVLVGNVARANVALVVSQPLQPNITQVGTLTGLYSTGNVTASFFSGQGNALTNVQSSVLVGNVANANVALVVSQPLQPNITQVGTLAGLYSTGNIVASYFAGQGNGLTNIQSSVLVGNVANANVALVVSQPLQPNITQVGTLTGLYATGNVTASFFAGQGNALTNIQSASFVGNVAAANVALVVSQNAQPNVTSLGTLAFLNVAGTSNTVNLEVAGSFLANSSYAGFLFDTFTIPYVNAVSGLNVTGVSNLTAVWGSLATPAQPNVTSLGTLTGLTVNGLLSSTNGSGIANLTAASITGNVAQANIALVVSQSLQPNITQVGTLVGLYSTGNVTASFFAGQGNALSNIQSSVLVGNVASANTALVVTQPLQPNITQVGTLTGLYATGNVTAPFFIGGGNTLSNINASNVTFGALAASQLQTAQTNITSVGTLTSLTVSGQSNLQTLNVASVVTPGVIPVSSGLFMNLNASYTLNSTGNWTGNIAGSITSNLFTLFGPNPLASWTTYGSNPLITGPTANGGFRFGQTGPYQFTIVLCSDHNIKTVALSSNTSDVHSNVADPGVWLYCYRISVGQDPSVPIQIPFYVDSTTKYYYVDFEAMQKTGENIHRTAYTNVTAEGYTGSYVTLRPL